MTTLKYNGLQYNYLCKYLIVQTPKFIRLEKNINEKKFLRYMCYIPMSVHLFH